MGLFGLATATRRVCAVMWRSTSSVGKVKFVSRWNFDNPCPSRGCKYLVHRECRNHNQDFVIGFEVSLTNQVDSFVHAIGQQELLRADPELIGGYDFHGFAFRITRKFFDLRDFEFV